MASINPGILRQLYQEFHYSYQWRVFCRHGVIICHRSQHEDTKPALRDEYTVYGELTEVLERTEFNLVNVLFVHSTLTNSTGAGAPVLPPLG